MLENGCISKLYPIPLFASYFKTGSPSVAHVGYELTDESTLACYYWFSPSSSEYLGIQAYTIMSGSAAKYWSIVICAAKQRTYSMIFPSNTQSAYASQESYVLGNWY